MVFTTLGAGWFVKTLAILFVWALDSIAYLLVSVSYSLFVAVSQLNLFATDGGAALYSGLTSRIYSLLSIVMVFVFAYFLIMMIVEPEGNNNKSTSGLVKETIISLIAIVLMPVIFNYMSLFQTHVLQENTIGAIILGTNGTVSDNPGKQISMIVFSSLYHPVGSGYDVFIDNEGKLKEDAVEVCEANGASNKVCQEYNDGLKGWLDNPDSSSIYSLTSRSKLRGAIGDDGGMTYSFILSTACAILVAYLFISYAIDLGTRAVKLGVLQLIAPIPVILRIFPKSKKNFDNWFTELKKTYLEVFVRVAIIFFIVYLCQQVPYFIDAIFSSGTAVEGGFTVKMFATVCLILGLLKFAKEAPDMFKAIFSGDLFKGLDFKPGVKRRIQENEYAMKGISTTAGAVGGVAGSAFMRYQDSLSRQRERQLAGETEANPSRARAFGAALTAMPRGIITGAKKGYNVTPKELKVENIKKSADAGLGAGQASLVHAENVYQKFGDGVKAFKDDPTAWAQTHIDTAKKDFEEKRNDTFDYFAGKHASGDAAMETLKKATDNISKYFDMTKGSVKNFEDAISELSKKIISQGYIDYGGERYTTNGGESYVDANGNTREALKWENLKADIQAKKNAEIAKKMTDSLKTGGTANMATLRDQMKKEMSNLGRDTIEKLNAKVTAAGLKNTDGSDISNISQFLEKMSDKNATFTASDIKTLNDVKSILSNQQKNIVIEQQAKPKEESKK